MRDPIRKAAIWLALTLAGAGLVWFGAVRLERVGEDWTSIAPIFVGLMIAPISFILLIQSLFAARGQALLLAGRRVLARWHVDALDWERFRALDARRAAEHPDLTNDFSLRKASRPRGVDVIVGEKSLLVEGSYHVLRPGGLPGLYAIGWLEGPPLCLEFSLVYPRGRYGGTVRLTLRVPAPATARTDARRVYDHFAPRLQRGPAIALRNPTKSIVLALLLAVLAAGAAGIGFAMVAAGSQSLAALLLAVAGTIIAPAALVFTLIVALIRLRT